MLRQISVFDPTVSSDNLGDQIIMRAINAQLDEILPDAFRIAVPTHDFTLWPSRRATQNCELQFVAGSNLLKSRMFWNGQWKLSPIDPFLLKNVVLFGCGWRNYQASPDFITRAMLKAMLDGNRTHSVRDAYTAAQLKAAGIHNVLNTACPTMWRLTPEYCARIPKAKADSVVCTLTEYERDPARDRRMMQTLLASYDQVYFFGQQPPDFGYLQDLDLPAVTVLPPSLDAFDRLLSTQSIDYVGTRLHGGIFSLAHGRRSLIIGIDNRAAEIARDTGLPVLERQRIEALAGWIDEPAPTSITLPADAIETWRKQFRAPARPVQSAPVREIA